MRSLQDPFETRKQSFISILSICLTVPLTAFSCFLFSISINCFRKKVPS